MSKKRPRKNPSSTSGIHPIVIVVKQKTSAATIAGLVITLLLAEGVARWLLGTQEGGLLLSGDSGKTWRKLGLDGTTVLDIGIDPSDSSRIIAATTTALRLTAAGGTTGCK